MVDTNQREIAESQFERNQRREAEVEDALKQERGRHEAAVNNMHRLRALPQCPLRILRNSIADNRLDLPDRQRMVTLSDYHSRPVLTAREVACQKRLPILTPKP